jgi:hypothetical protein
MEDLKTENTHLKIRVETLREEIKNAVHDFERNSECICCSNNAMIKMNLDHSIESDNYLKAIAESPLPAVKV